MYNEFEFLNSKTTTESDTAKQTYSGTDTYSSAEQKVNETYDYNDDYSVAQNYEEESGYNTTAAVNMTGEQAEEAYYQSIYAPVIQHKAAEKKHEEAVTLTKQREVIKLTGRLKIVFAMFAIIFAALVAVVAYNFSAASRLNGTLASKQERIEELQLSITELTSEYNLVSSDGYIVDFAENANFVKADESNTVVINLGEMYTKTPVQEVPSNWFDDVCEFFSKLFG